MKQNRTELITINTFLGLPPVKNLFELFKSSGETIILHQTISNFDDFLITASEYHLINTFKTSQTYNRQTIFNKIRKYVVVFNYLLLEFFKSKVYQKARKIYIIDLFTLICSIFFKQKNDILIYHQFEIIEHSNLNRLDKIIFKLLQKRIKKVDLIIIPEVNRCHYFMEIFPFCKSNQIILIPNTNSNKIDICYKKTNQKIRITHIGAIGKEHHLESLLKAFSTLPESSFELLFVGFLDSDVKNILNDFELPNLIILDQVKHNQLDEIYRITDIGLILYKDISLNHKFCAPNKLYEYWSYGIPIIGDNLPGLLSLSMDKELGKLINLSDCNEIINAICELSTYNKMDVQNIFIKKYCFENFLDLLKIKLDIQ